MILNPKKKNVQKLGTMSTKEKRIENSTEAEHSRAEKVAGRLLLTIGYVIFLTARLFLTDKNRAFFFQMVQMGFIHLAIERQTLFLSL